MFDHHLLDMLELGVLGFEPMAEIVGPKKFVGSCPMMVFNGDEWDRTPDLVKLRSLLLDVFAARDVTSVALAGLDHVIALTVRGDVVHWRTFFMHMRKAASGLVPRVELVPMGPSLDLELRRVHSAGADLEKAAMKQPKA